MNSGHSLARNSLETIKETLIKPAGIRRRRNARALSKRKIIGLNRSILEILTIDI